VVGDGPAIAAAAAAAAMEEEEDGVIWWGRDGSLLLEGSEGGLDWDGGGFCFFLYLYVGLESPVIAFVLMFCLLLLFVLVPLIGDKLVEERTDTPAVFVVFPVFVAFAV